ncbi:5-carboxymethyl-2-hydroxymuconate Delta-isomerase [Acinetobacter ursingii]|uniref:5-carboxymethyl-2-hydroxymuconate Delta-isomerase n=1 Tax=Acinetobacter ursingii TaxID=108980 RepID=UPI0022EAB56F|nr:5-carboxymethyl-2-hydroxymuconate Delta-isomerase [Acinetobacter ursingii]MDA3578502.1 5-carboxymethyl-2-hydroxymuconate Delta-isomerase [Acinetobacter ursingii]MDH0806721.1 5-carboxymethyl-2-hydroxymuconate Delta-isomerase [Acinetobacter ursingii]MDH2073988.1 5-carboxymethyl-2-hydroxymuconate Delta-isomerase [Acinetobacter ursingii]
MPHVIVDYSANLKDFEPRPLLLQINTALVETGYCEALDIKSRARQDNVFVIGLGTEQQAYVHVKVYLLSGRDQQQKQEIGKNVLKVLVSYSALQQQDFAVQSCVELIEMPKQDYFKHVIKSQF